MIRLIKKYQSKKKKGKTIKAFWKYLISENIRLFEKNLIAELKEIQEINSCISNQSMISSSAIRCGIFSSPKLPALGKTYSYLTEIINGLS